MERPSGLAVAGLLVSPASSSGPERGCLENAVKTLERNLPVEKRCEKLFTSLSGDLAAKKISTRAALKSRQGSVRGCFAAMEKQFVGARASLRQVLKLNDVSEQTDQAEIVKKGWIVA